MKELIETLISKKIKITEIPKWGPYLRAKWEKAFANHMSDKEKKSIYLYDGFLWHIFSFEKKACSNEEQANRDFNSESKSFCYVFYQLSDDALIIENGSLITADDFENGQDIYIVDKGFNWTYVKTHETGLCGPYFSRK